MSSVKKWATPSVTAHLSSERGGISMDRVTAGRDSMGTFAPKFAELNDDVLFGEVWSREAEL